ncbi:hypothetical protein PoB_000050000 [Plakobranchus ocellatus]|uniref:Lysosome-associated membrane glycoprotein 5 n=1 Tax=Plakobranchus ocellatus TaxID=259542 RepID=A0AAV3XT40_9GAST|nr:hypothetical protein PoB_000050000 [Plakobranchus ocellatus]
MKIFIFAALLALAVAKNFRVKKDNKTCALLSLDGNLELTASQNASQVGKEDLPFSGATLIADSTCKLIKLNLSKSAQVWFQFDNDQQNWKVTPVSTFIPEQVFGDAVNDTTALVLNAKPLEVFPMTSSYLCKSSAQLNFVPRTEPKDYNFTVTATINNFQIQSLNAESFSTKEKECVADTKPKDYECKSGNKTVIMMEGNFTLDISYFKEEGGKVQNVTKTIIVPAPENATTEGSCDVKATTQSLSIKFFDTWAINFVFTKKDSSYSVTNTSVVYTFDDNLPGHNETGSVTVNFAFSNDYLKASADGYYICNAYLNNTKNGVTLSSKNFKYRAFDENGKGFEGNVSECSADEDTSSVVPIAVGAALAGLVVIVLIAYLIGRKRTRKTGYESV